MEGAASGSRTALSEGQRGRWAAADFSGAHAARLLSAALVQPVGPGREEALYDSESMRRFAGIDLGQESAPDETTVCKFRHLLERNKLGKKLLSRVNAYLADNGIKISKGTIVDATIIGAPSSTKNRKGERDPEMHQTAKGKQWYFGVKAHVAVDSRHKLIHTVLASAANVADSLALPHLLHGEETCVWGDQAYQGHTATIRSVAPRARDCTNRALSLSRPDRRSDQGQEPQQIAGARQGRALDRCDQARLRFPEGALSGACEELASPGGDCGARKSVHGAAPIARSVGDVRPESGGCA